MMIRFRPVVRLAAVAATPALLLSAAAAFSRSGAASPPRKVEFDRDIRPILSENCFKCHGFDASQRVAGLRLDTEQGARSKLPSGNVAIVPGKPADSALWMRVSSRSPIQMPPPASGKKLKPAQIAMLKRWIEQGAHYAQHWAFVPPVRPAVPAPPPAPFMKGRAAAWPHNPIDRFVLARLARAGLPPSPEADRRTLVRRLYLDLLGLPPSSAEVDAFLADHRPGAYELLVERLLANPHYGERMALQWLDLARYADTHGYHIDSQRDMWRWRDWVIDAYNRNMPYNEFVTEQIAGDLLPNATLDQRIATGFNRNHPINFEGGAIPEEYAAAYIEDRIDTTATTFLGLTLRCAQCHDHKFDPFTMKDYYRFYAYFNNVPEQGLDGQKGNAAPFIKAPTAEEQRSLEAARAKLAEADGKVKQRVAAAGPALVGWAKTAIASLMNGSALNQGLAAYYPLAEGKGNRAAEARGSSAAATIRGKPDWSEGQVGSALKFDGATWCDLGTAFAFDRTDPASYGAWVNPASAEHMTVLSRMDDAAKNRGWDLYLGDGKVFAHLISAWDSNAIRVNTKAGIPQNQWSHLFVTYDGSGKAEGVRIYVNGKPAEMEITHNSLTGSIKAEKPVAVGRRTPGAPFKGLIDEVRLYRRALAPGEVEQLAGLEPLRRILQTEDARRTPAQKDTLARYYLQTTDPEFPKLVAAQAARKREADSLEAAIPTTMVMQEMPKPRDTFMLVRGQYDKRGDKVTGPATPAIFAPPPKSAPPNRLGLAMWLTDPANPLTARVAVNRYWMALFGNGLVRTPENFGMQGERPTHPELLDWLATEFERSGWNVKHMVRLMVCSSTYRQSSRVTPELLEKDPENRLLARAPRFRLVAEFVRDQALQVSGLLVPELGGPPVKPYQPAGLWEEISFKGEFSAQYFVQDHGDKLYRRSMYTFWKRTVPPPSLQTFDAPEREFCIVRRSVTNTPLQALVLMNDPTYVEASRKFAERILSEPPAGTRDRIQFAWRSAVGRPAREPEMRVMLAMLAAQRDRFHRDPAAAEKLLAVGESPRNARFAATELAAWTLVASAILNLDETITRN